MLWNFTVQHEESDLAEPDNLSLLTSFTGTEDENWFYMISVAIEARGAKLLQMMLNTIDAVKANDSAGVTSLLRAFTNGLKDSGRVLERMYEHCAPAVFFHHLRPFLAGSKNMAAAGLPNGVFYDRGDGIGEWHQYSGGSNAQSSLIQAFDIFLGVEHSASGNIKSDQTRQTPSKNGYIQVCEIKTITIGYFAKTNWPSI